MSFRGGRGGGGRGFGGRGGGRGFGGRGGGRQQVSHFLNSEFRTDF